jgi:hypothetical protein
VIGRDPGIGTEFCSSGASTLTDDWRMGLRASIIIATLL